MRRKKPAMTTAVLVAVFAATTVKAQQSSSSGSEPLGQSQPSGRTAKAGQTRPSPDDQVYGVAVTRGARYLLRNGLDYVNYREYERALKFLREAEIRKDELTKAEKQVLQNGIESAKRGLRQAAGAESPYALSERSRNRNGFSPAKAETYVTHETNPDRLQKLPSKSVRGPSGGLTTPPGNATDDQGEPILLTNGNSGSSNSTSQNPVIQSNQTGDNPSTVLHDSEGPRPLPDIPKIPQLAQKQNETDGLPTELGKSTDKINEHLSEQIIDQPQVQPVPRQDTPVSRVSALASTPVSPVVSTPSGDTSTQPAIVDDVPKNTLTPPLVELETTPALPPATQITSQDDSTTLAHKESDETSTVPARKQESALPTPAMLPESTSTPSPSTDDLPPLPIDLGTKSEVTDSPKQTSSPVTVSSVSTTSSPSDENELPALPDDVSNSARQGHDAPVRAPEMISEVVNPTAVPPAVQDLPTLPDDSSSQESHALGSQTRNAIQSTSAAAPVGEQNGSMVQPSANSDAAPSNPAVRDAAEASQLASPHIEESTQTVSPGATQPLTNDASAAIESNGGSASAPPAIENLPSLPGRSDNFIPSRPNPASTLRPELKREVEMIVRQQEDDLRRKQQVQAQPGNRRPDTISSDLRSQTQLDISRAPSPAEARPIKAIPVPEDWVPLPPRTWAAQRKYWAAAATCHLPLYFQDPVLERYGHSVEQFLGPVGRYLTYPLDDPTQSTQRNQILQPFFSAGLFAFQIAALPYNVIMDPPWEAQYDLGYYRPGDNVPTDTYWLPLHGYGPPLRGSNY